MTRDGLIVCIFLLTIICRVYQCHEDHCIRKFESSSYEVNCTTSSSWYINVRDYGYGVQIRCHGDANWTVLPYLMNITVQPYTPLLDISGCHLPDEPIHVIGRKVCIKHLEKLSLNLVHNTTLKNIHLQGLCNLTVLYLTNAIVTEFDVLDYVKGLKEFTADNCSIPSLYKNLMNMKKLEKFSASNMLLNFPTNLSRQYLGDQKQLKEITLYNIDNIENFQWNPFRELTSVTVLKIENSGVKNLPDDFLDNYENLRILELTSNNLTTFPKNLLAKNTNLTRVNISGNANLTLPTAFFASLPKLEQVLACESNMVRVPEDLIRGSKFLKVLNFNGNQLTTLPRGIFKDSENLQTLLLACNKISYLPDGIFFTAFELKRLHLNANDLTAITEYMFAGLRDLQYLYLQFNKLEYIHINAFESLLNVRLIDLSHNRLSFDYAPPSIFEAFHGSMSPFDKLSSLSELHLSHNEIREVVRPRGWVPYDFLDLSYNHISSISELDFFYQSPNITVDLRHNAIRGIVFDKVDIYAAVALKDIIFTEKRNINILLDDNPLHCDCHVYNFITHLSAGAYPQVEHIFHIVPGNMSCASPYWMQGQSVKDVNLEKLICLVSLCPENCTCWRTPYRQRYTIDCTNLNLTKVPEIRRLPKGNDVMLDLRGNLLTESPLINDTKFEGLSILLLSENNITVLHEETISHTLKVLEMHNNNITTINGSVLNALKNSRNLKFLTLHENPWKCDCDAKGLLNFVAIKAKNFTQLSSVQCSTGETIAELTIHQLCQPMAATITVASLVVTLAAFMLAAITALYYKNQRVLKVWLYSRQLCLTFVTEKEIDKDKQYDAFISYSHKDEDFVVKELLEKLEQGPIPYKICIHFRDWIIGDSIPDQIVRSVEESRRTLIVISANFLESVWGRLEFRTAHNQALNDGTARIIIILYGDIGPIDELDTELKTYLNSNTYLQWGDPWFWEKLSTEYTAMSSLFPFTAHHDSQAHVTSDPPLPDVSELNIVSFNSNSAATNDSFRKLFTKFPSLDKETSLAKCISSA